VRDIPAEFDHEESMQKTLAGTANVTERATISSPRQGFGSALPFRLYFQSNSSLPFLLEFLETIQVR
jgi:hypothetical protein